MIDPTAELFQASLGLKEPWYVTDIRFNSEGNRIDIYIDFKKGAHFLCPSCQQQECGVYDTKDRTWRHMNFFQHAAYIHARVPRIWCDKCEIKTITPPWARSGSSFTFLFEAYVVTLAREMPVNAIARLVGEHDTRLWRVIRYYVEDARSRVSMEHLISVAVDETSAAKGHSYVTVFTDIENAKVLFVTPGKDAQTLEAFRQDLIAHHGDPQTVEQFCSDLSPAFISGIEKHFPSSSLTFDKFHISKLLGDAVDQVRRSEQRSHPELKRTRYAWLKNPANLTEEQQLQIQHLSKIHLKTAKAYQIRLTFQDFWQQTKENAEAFLNHWYFWATHCRLEPMIKAAKTIRKHQKGILEWFRSRITNGLSEGLNSLIQSTKRKARGYRSVRNFITMIYLTLGKLDFRLPI
jgi:transposase